jgi:hypothetical protein
VCLQLAQYLHADESPWAAAVCAALHDPSASQAAPAAIGAHTRSRGPPPPQLSPQRICAKCLLAEQHADVLAAVAAAHPALMDHRRPLLCHKLAALPPVLRGAACDAVVRRGSGEASGGLRDGAQLVPALKVLASSAGLVSVSVGLDTNGYDGTKLWPPRVATPAEQSTALSVQPRIKLFTQLTSLDVLGISMDVAEALLMTAAAMPSLSRLHLAITHSNDGISPTRGDAFCAGMARCHALSALILDGLPRITGHCVVLRASMTGRIAWPPSRRSPAWRTSGWPNMAVASGRLPRHWRTCHISRTLHCTMACSSRADGCAAPQLIPRCSSLSSMMSARMWHGRIWAAGFSISRSRRTWACTPSAKCATRTTRPARQSASCRR